MATGIGYLVGMLLIVFASRLTIRTIQTQKNAINEEGYDKGKFMPVYIFAFIILVLGTWIVSDAIQTWHALSNARTLVSFR